MFTVCDYIMTKSGNNCSNIYDHKKYVSQPVICYRKYRLTAFPVMVAISLNLEKTALTVSLGGANIVLWELRLDCGVKQILFS